MGARMRWITAGWLVPALLWLSASFTTSASAQSYAREGFRLERLALAPTPEDGIALTLPDTLGHLRWSSTLALSYVLNPFQFRGPPEQSLVAQRLSADLAFAIGVYEDFEAYARVPFVLVSAGDNVLVERTTLAAPGGIALGDAAFGATANVFQFRDLSLGARAELLLPTGSQSELTGDYAIAPRAHALAAYRWWKLTFGLEGGAVYRPERDYALVRIGSEYEWVMGSKLALRETFDLGLEAFGTRSARRPRDSAALDTLDLLFAGRHRAPVGVLCLHTSAAIGTGFSDAAGDPDLRVVFNIALTSEKGAEPSRPKAHDVFSPASAAARQKH